MLTVTPPDLSISRRKVGENVLIALGRWSIIDLDGWIAILLTAHQSQLKANDTKKLTVT
jgi:hypothetical protein